MRQAGSCIRNQTCFCSSLSFPPSSPIPKSHPLSHSRSHFLRLTRWAPEEKNSALSSLSFFSSPLYFPRPLITLFLPLSGFLSDRDFPHLSSLVPFWIFAHVSLVLNSALLCFLLCLSISLFLTPSHFLRTLSLNVSPISVTTSPVFLCPLCKTRLTK